MPHLAVSLMVIFGFLGAALCLRVLANSVPARTPVRAGEPELRARHAMMNE
ncbi:hypothetical protein [Nocardia sp. NBC_01388]|uniref:hypothetical protein n=1 Tax=Nocardia sp. NBC_01388 TaxID=2903596 RepID=UPI00324334C9